MINIPNAVRGHSRLVGTVDLKTLSNNYRPLFYFYGVANQRITHSSESTYQTFTFSAFIKYESGGGSHHYEIMSKRSYYATSYNDFPTCFNIKSDTKKLYCHIDSGSDWAADLDLSSTQILSENTWYHVAATYNSPNLILYVNGETTSTSGAVTLSSNARKWTIGNYSNDYDSGTNTGMFKGWILDPRIYNIAKSKDEIINIKNGYDDQGGLVISFSKTNLPLGRY